MAAHPDRVACDPYSKHFLLLDVVVNSSAIDINNFGRSRDSNNFHVFAAPFAPNFFARY